MKTACAQWLLVICTISTGCNNAKQIRHPGQESVDNSFSMNMGSILFIFGQKILAWCSIVWQEGFCSNHCAKECCVGVGNIIGLHPDSRCKSCKLA